MIQKQTTTDPVLDEIQQPASQISERFGGDLHAPILRQRCKRNRDGSPASGRHRGARRTKRCNGAAEVTFLIAAESARRGPAERRRSSTRALLSTQEH